MALANLKKGRNADGSKRSTTVRRSLLASIFSGKSNGRDADESENVKVAKAVAKKAPAKKPSAAKPVAVAVAEVPKKAKGPDPFSLESNAAKKAADIEQQKVALAQQKEAEKAEQLAKEVEEKLEAEKTQIASLVPETRNRS